MLEEVSFALEFIVSICRGAADATQCLAAPLKSWMPSGRAASCRNLELATSLKKGDHPILLKYFGFPSLHLNIVQTLQLLPAAPKIVFDSELLASSKVINTMIRQLSSPLPLFLPSPA